MNKTTRNGNSVLIKRAVEEGPFMVVLLDGGGEGEEDNGDVTTHC